MTDPDIVSVVESAMHPNYTDLYRELGLAETKVNSIRKAIGLCRKSAPRFIIAEFFYAYSTNYSGVHKSNLDVLLISLNKYAPQTRMIVLADKDDARHWDVLNEWAASIRGRLVHPTNRDEMRDLLT